MFNVDKVADLMYGRMPVERGWWRFPHAPTLEVCWRGRVLRGKVRDKLKVVVKQERFLQWRWEKAASGGGWREV